MKLGGVIYLQSIADKRMMGTTRRNLDMFSQLCGDKALARVVLGTTVPIRSIRQGMLRVTQLPKFSFQHLAEMTITSFFFRRLF